MKPIKLLLCHLFSVYWFGLFAQYNNFYIGPEGGPGLAFLWGNGANKTNEKAAVSGYVAYTFQYNFNKIISLRTEAAYEREGGTYSLGPATQHLKSDYMTLPVLARATFGKKVNFFINAGPYWSVLIKLVNQNKDSFSGTTTVTDETSRCKRLDAGITTGVGFAVPLGNRMAVTFEARNNTGLYNFNNVAGSSGIIRNNATHFIFGFRYEIITRKSSRKKADVKA